MLPSFDGLQKKVVVLDVRNDYEWDAGHFQGAERPTEEEFVQTPVGESDEDIPEPLRGADRDTPVMVSQMHALLAALVLYLARLKDRICNSWLLGPGMRGHGA